MQQPIRIKCFRESSKAVTMCDIAYYLFNVIYVLFCLLHCSTRCPVHTLEADSVLSGGVFDCEKRRGDSRHRQHEAKREERGMCPLY